MIEDKRVIRIKYIRFLDKFKKKLFYIITNNEDSLHEKKEKINVEYNKFIQIDSIELYSSSHKETKKFCNEMLNILNIQNDELEDFQAYIKILYNKIESNKNSTTNKKIKHKNKFI